jgi:hypothetical protein
MSGECKGINHETRSLKWGMARDEWYVFVSSGLQIMEHHLQKRAMCWFAVGRWIECNRVLFNGFGMTGSNTG